MRERYPSDLTDTEWTFLEPLIPGGSRFGRPPKYCKRQIVNAIFYLVRSGCAWRMLAHDLPPWRICYHYFMVWKRDGIWEGIHERMRELVRLSHGKKKRQPL
ncbi:transposase, partial [Cerasicoccus arenae]|uniref:transposase n=1 Tax=Cerasicoccus arenae TaxID=424488 RepID=UPI0019068BB1|nr:transposase [Cerasicoccus arenae]